MALLVKLKSIVDRPILHSSYIFPWTRDSQCQNSADILAENTPNALKNVSPIYVPNPKSFSLLVSIVRAYAYSGL